MNTFDILNSVDSFEHLIFFGVAGALYGAAFILGVSYKAMNIYAYFVLFPLSFLLFFKGRLKYVPLILSPAVLYLPGFEPFSVEFFGTCERFLNNLATIFGSNYIDMSVVICVWLPLGIYVYALFYYRFITVLHLRKNRVDRVFGKRVYLGKIV